MNNLTLIKKPLTMLLTLVILLAIIGPALAQESMTASGRTIPAVSSQPQGLSDPGELETFLDKLMAKELEENHIAGAAVSVVKDGRLFFAKGYGYANLEKGTPVDAEKTIFRIGSNGKTFTWTAVMQLVEQGKLDLDADVNTYLDFRIPDTYPQPITLKHLLTHTTGFDERWAGSMVTDAKDRVPAGEWLEAHMAERVNPPGESVAYSNYNAMLAGYIVSRASEQPYDQYIQEHILDPLGMQHSSAQDPMPSALRPFLSLGYYYFDGEYLVTPEYWTQPALLPSGSHLATVTDMARFMIAHLQNGRYGDENTPETRIFEEATAQQMHNTQYTPDPRFLGLTYGFFDFSQNGQRTIGHRGFAASMNSLMLLLLDQNLGIFVVYNSDGAGEIADPHADFQSAFFDHYFPASPMEPLQPSADFSKQAGRFVGIYRQTAFPHGSFLKVAGLFDAMTAKIHDPGDGTLVLTYDSSYLSGVEMRFIEVEPLYFRQVDGPFAIVFGEDDRGRITHLYVDPVNFTAFEKLDWYDESGFNLALLMVCSLGFLSAIPITTIRLVRDRRQRNGRKPASLGATTANWIVLVASILNLLIVAGTAWGAQVGITSYLLEPPLVIKITMGLGILATVLTVGVLVSTALAWKNRYWGLTSRLYYTLMTFAAVAFVWFLNFWHLIGWQY